MWLHSFALTSTFLLFTASASPLAQRHAIAVVPCFNGQTTITASSQLVTYSASTAETVGTKTCTKAGYCTIGTSVTHVSKPTAIVYHAPEVVYYGYPYSSHHDVVDCESCTKYITVSYCHLGQCVKHTEVREPKAVYHAKPTHKTVKISKVCPSKTKITTVGTTIYVPRPTTLITTLTYLDTVTSTKLKTITSTLGECSTTLTAPYKTASPVYVTETSSYGNKPTYTTTSGSTVYVICPTQKHSPTPVKTVTVTTTLPPGQYGFISTYPGTVVIGKPTHKKHKHYPKPTSTPYTTSTSYLSYGEGFTSTTGYSVIVGVPQSTTTITESLIPGASPYTSTIPAIDDVEGIVEIGVPTPFVTTTTYEDLAFTSTTGDSVIIGIPQSTTTITVSVPAGSGYTSTVPAVGSAEGTVVVGTPSAYVTTTVYLSPGVPEFTSTTDGTIDIGADVTFTTFTTLDAVVSTTTETIEPSGSVPGTVIVELPAVITATVTDGAVQATATSTLPDGQSEVVVTVPCNIPGYFNYAFYNNPFSDSDETYSSFDPSYFSTADVIAAGTYPAAGLTVSVPATEGPQKIYHETIDLKQKAANIVFYLYSDVAQTISLFPESWDIEYIFTGANAISGYTANNWGGESLHWTGNTPGNPKSVIQFAVDAGSYTPVRLVFGFSTSSEEVNVAEFRLDIYGNVKLPTMYQAVCPNAAPAFPPFSQS